MATEGVRPLIVIVGPTASGKTALAIEIASRHDGEIIAADSRTVIRDMDIGTAKPTVRERAQVAHYGFDQVEPGERYTAADFQQYANRVIEEIRSRGKLPIMTGGTGLYIDGVIYDYKYPAEPTTEQRNRFEAMTVEELYSYCIQNNVELPINDKNKRHLVRKILHSGIGEQRSRAVRSNTFVYGIAVEKTTLRTRIAQRTEQMFADGIVEEAIMLGKKYGWDSEIQLGNIYPLLHDYIRGVVSLDQAKDAFMVRDRQLAKRQMTWFRRNSEIAWGSAADISSRVNDVLASG